MTEPQAFLCHASADKTGYVEPFGRFLASKGIRPWLDGWDIRPGDSILTKIEEGITGADYFLPFVSPRSIESNWVRAEIEMAVTRKLLDKLRIIPVFVEVGVESAPLFLQTIKGVKLPNDTEVGRAGQEAVDAIYGVPRGPVVAESPSYTLLPPVRGLSSADTAFLKAVCEESVERDRTLISLESVTERLNGSGLAPETIKESVAILCEKHYLKRHGVAGNPNKRLEVLPHGFQTYGMEFVEGYADNYKRIAAIIAGEPDYHPSANAETISRQLGIPHRIVNHVYEHLALYGKITLNPLISPSRKAATVSPNFRREMTSG